MNGDEVIGYTVATLDIDGDWTVGDTDVYPTIDLAERALERFEMNSERTGSRVAEVRLLPLARWDELAVRRDFGEGDHTDVIPVVTSTPTSTTANTPMSAGNGRSDVTPA